MKIELTSNPFGLTPALADYSRTQVSYAMSRFSPKIQRVRVVLLDVNGPRGGVDKLCRMEAALAHLPAVVVQFASCDGYDAVKQAAHRLGRAVERRVKRAARWVSGGKRVSDDERADGISW
jgi:putative sigma-54 modulation protein